jgi:hypothetical protein
MILLAVMFTFRGRDRRASPTLIYRLSKLWTLDALVIASGHV